MHFLLQENVSDFCYTSINLNKHGFRILWPWNENVHQDAIFSNLFDHHGSCLPNLNEMTFLRFCKKYMTIKQGNLIPRTKRTVVLAFTFWSSDSDSIYYHIYCKFFIIKHKPWFGDISNAWDGSIENTYDAEHNLDENGPICKAWYIKKFNEFSEKVDISLLYMLNTDVDKLRRIREEWKYFYME